MNDEQQRARQLRPLHGMVSLRASTSTHFRPAEEQFIEQTPWANPHHPSHAHRIHRQTSANHTARTVSPFGMPVNGAPRRHSHHQNGAGIPMSGTFSTIQPAATIHANGAALLDHGEPQSLSTYANTSIGHKIAPSPLASRQPSLSPQPTIAPPLPEEPDESRQAAQVLEAALMDRERVEALKTEAMAGRKQQPLVEQTHEYGYESAPLHREQPVEVLGQE